MIHSKKIYISLIIFVLLNAAIIVFLIFPIFRSINKDAQGFLSWRDELISTEAKIENLRNFSEVYKNYQQNLDKLGNVFVNKDVPIEFINFLGITAQNHQLIIKVSSVTSEESKNNPWQILNFQISIYGSFPNFLKFLGKLENSPYLAEVQNLNIKNLGGVKSDIEGFENLSANDINVTFVLKVATKSYK